MEKTASKIKNYPKKVGANRYEYIRWPVLVTKEVLEKAATHQVTGLNNLEADSYYIGILVKGEGYMIPSIVYPYKSFELCKQHCDMLNRSNGFTPNQINSILATSERNKKPDETNKKRRP